MKKSGVWKGGGAPFLGCRRWMNIGVQGRIPRFGEDGVIGAGAAPLFEPGSPGFFIASKLKTLEANSKARHAWPLHHGAIYLI